MKRLLSRNLSTSLLLASCLAMVAGCATSGGGRNRIGEIHLFGLPTALTTAGSSLPTGVGLRIYASEVGGSRGVPIRQGRLEVLMFDGPATGLDPRTSPPLKVWSFQAAELAPFGAVTMMGTGYTLQLNWGQNRPKGKVITLLARHISPDKTEVYSTPATISVTAH